MTDLRRWRGLIALTKDAVVHGSRAVERIQLETARRPFWVLEQIPMIAEPTKIVHVIHDGVVSGVHYGIRQVTEIIGSTADTVLQTLDEKRAIWLSSIALRRTLQTIVRPT